ncbi:hypothetical protein C8R42DRAFT_644583 [Lentinula raphanica]|nr:hypothetical protein C8R42DRAFT_644583 [Lentinula raphanica]
MNVFPRFDSSASPDEVATPYSSPPRSITPILYSEPDSSAYPLYDRHALREALAQSEREDAEWQILFERLGRAPTPFKSPPPPGWSYFGSYPGSSSGGSSGTGYITPKSRSVSPPKSYPYLKFQGAARESSPSRTSYYADSSVMEMDEDGPDMDVKAYSGSRISAISDDGDVSWSRGNADVYNAHANVAEEMQNFSTLKSSPVDLRVVNSKLTELVDSSTTARTRRRKLKPVVPQTSPRVTRSVAKRRLQLELAGS